MKLGVHQLRDDASSKFRKCRKIGLSKFVIICLLPIAMAGCSGIDSKPYAHFSSAASELHSGTTAATAQIVDLASDNLTADVAEGLLEHDASKYNEIMISGSYDPSDPKYFMEIYRFQASISSLTLAFEEYAKLLLEMVSNEAADDAFIDKMQSEIATATAQAQLAFQTEMSQSSIEATGLLAAGSAELLKAYLESQRKEDLVAALEGNQPIIEDYSDHMIAAIEILRASAELETVESQRRVLNSGIRTLGGNEVKAEALSNSLIAVSKKYYKLDGDLILLKTAFTRFPKAHKELLELTIDGQASIESILQLEKTATKLYSNYQQSIRDIAKISAQSELERYTSEAARMNSEAATLSLLHAQASADLVLAKQASSANPGDQSLQDRAKNQENRVNVLSEALEKKQKEAKEYSDAVNSIIEKNLLIHSQ